MLVAIINQFLNETESGSSVWEVDGVAYASNAYVSNALRLARSNKPTYYLIDGHKESREDYDKASIIVLSKCLFDGYFRKNKDLASTVDVMCLSGEMVVGSKSMLQKYGIKIIGADNGAEADEQYSTVKTVD